jgi:NTP pyrophosphatase (non-canonical NTP hydrolase)
VIELPEGAPLRAYQTYVHELEALHGWLGADLVRNGFLMGEEVGELLGAMRKVQRQLDAGQPRDALPPALVEHVGEEIVDVLNYLLAIANRLDIDVEAAFRAKNAINQGRRWG